GPMTHTKHRGNNSQRNYALLAVAADLRRRSVPRGLDFRGAMVQPRDDEAGNDIDRQQGSVEGAHSRQQSAGLSKEHPRGEALTRAASSRQARTFSNKSRAAIENARILSTRSLLPVSTVIERSPAGPMIAMQECPAAWP